MFDFINPRMERQILSGNSNRLIEMDIMRSFEVRRDGKLVDVALATALSRESDQFWAYCGFITPTLTKTEGDERLFNISCFLKQQNPILDSNAARVYYDEVKKAAALSLNQLEGFIHEYSKIYS